jgi:hypothetical protein
MVPSDDWGHIGARSRLDPLLSVFVDCVCEVTIFRHRRPTSGHRRSESKSQWPRGGRWPARLDSGERWPSRLVATASENRLDHKGRQLVVHLDAKRARGALRHRRDRGNCDLVERICGGTFVMGSERHRPRTLHSYCAPRWVLDRSPRGDQRAVSKIRRGTERGVDPALDINVDFLQQVDGIARAAPFWQMLHCYFANLPTEMVLPGVARETRR